EMVSGEKAPWCTEPQMLEREGKQAQTIMLRTSEVEGVEFPKEIYYWGHYPVVDMEFEGDMPVDVGMRAWAPFIPGDVAASNIPAAVFEVHLRNPGDQLQEGALAFSFPGPEGEEAQGVEFTRQNITEDFQGVLINSERGVQYLLGVIGIDEPRFGGSLNNAPTAWAGIATELPQPSFRESGNQRLYQNPSCSVAVDFSLEAGSQKIVRFLLCWYAPVLEGAKKNWEKEDYAVDGILRHRWIGSQWAGDTHYFTHMYAARFGSALDVARHMAEKASALLKRILAWQETIYSETDLPIWLRDSLVNNLALITEDSYWFQAKPPLGDYVYPEGAFALNESPRGCPHMSCIPCDWYGNLPIVFFYPELALSNLRLFKQYQRKDGEIPFAIGRIGELPDMATPEYYWQVSLNGMCYVDMVDRLWQRTGKDTILQEFYPSIKRCNTFTMNLRRGPGGPISMPEVGGMEWFEFGEWAGMASHLGGLRLAMLRIVERMAETSGDHEYAERCRAWYTEGSQAMEEKLWAGSYYLNFYDEETGKKSDDVMGYQLDGEWAAKYHGLPGVFKPDRVKTTLETIQRCNIGLTPSVGAANFTRPDGSPLSADSKVVAYGLYAMFPPELLVLAMTYIYAGEREFGLELAHRHWETLCLNQRHIWDLPNIVRGDTGVRVFGTDYYQNMMLWALPAALLGQDIRAFCAPEGLVERIMEAGKP
ncbi:MAG: GH116 family glycosyl hydrolase, partial [Anaerolineales bacterium]